MEVVVFVVLEIDSSVLWRTVLLSLPNITMVCANNTHELPQGSNEMDTPLFLSGASPEAQQLARETLRRAQDASARVSTRAKILMRRHADSEYFKNLMWEITSRDSLKRIITDPDHPYVASDEDRLRDTAYKGWSDAELQELFFVLYGAEAQAA